MSELISKLRNSSISLEMTTDDLYEYVASLFRSEDLVVFASLVLGLDKVERIGAVFVTNYATLSVDGEELATFQPLHIARCFLEEGSRTAIYSIMIYGNGHVILIDRSYEEEPLLYLFISKKVCDELGVEYRKVPLTTNTSTIEPGTSDGSESINRPN